MRHGLLLAALLGLTPLPALAQTAGEPVEVGDWTVSRTDSPDGSLKQCSAKLDYDDKSALTVTLMATKQVFLVIYQPDLTLQARRAYTGSYKLEDRPEVAVHALATEPTTLLVPIEDDAFMDSARVASTLTIEVAGRTIEEPLEGSDDAITQLRECVRAGLGGI